jgi:hypothetical protein
MAKLYVHGSCVTEYTKFFEGLGRCTYRVMSDGKILKNFGRGWKIARALKPEFRENMDLLISYGYVKTDGKAEGRG